ncbi:MAG: CvpA family protein [Alphaproteobacteria bacterium]
MENVNWVDVGAIAVVVISAVFAVARGFVREILSVAAWIGAAVIALYAFPPLRPHARELLGPTLIADIALGAVLFLFSLIILSLITHAIARSVRGSALSAVDRSLGLLFGIARGALLVCLAYLGLVWAMPAEEHPRAVREARALPLVQRGADWLVSIVPPDLRRRAIDETNRRAEQAREAERTYRVLTSPPPRSDSGGEARPGYPSDQRQGMDRLQRQIGQ